MKTNILLISEQLPYFRAIVRRSLPSRYMHLAEDLAQDAIVKAIEKDCGPWGITALRYEIKDIEPPSNISNAMIL